MNISIGPVCGGFSEATIRRSTMVENIRMLVDDFGEYAFIYIARRKVGVAEV